MAMWNTRRPRKTNGAEVIHLATGLVVGYPPYPRWQAFCEFIQAK